MERIFNIDDYQAKAEKTAVYDSPDYPVLALAEEVGEVLGKIAKFSRKTGNPTWVVVGLVEETSNEMEEKLRCDLRKEMGDVIWQWALLCKEFGFIPSEILTENIEKLTDRQNRNVLNGEGDNR